MRLRKMTLATALSLVMPFGSVFPATAAGLPANTYVVAIGGDDDGAGTIEDPWGTILQAMRKLTPGDTLWVREGTYTENVGWGISPGTATGRITVESYPGEEPLIVGSLSLKDAHYWTVRNIDVTADPERSPPVQFVAKFAGGWHWQFLDSEVWGGRGVSNLMVIAAEGTRPPVDYVIRGNCIRDNRATGDPFMNDHNIYLMPGYGSGPGLIERNILFDAPNGNNIKAAGPSSSTGAARVIIRYNTMARAGQGAVVAFRSREVRFHRNLIVQRVGGSSSYPGLRGFSLGNTTNVARFNAVWGYRDPVASTGGKAIRQYGNSLVRPYFDSFSCDGFHPGSEAARAFGRYA